MILHIENVKAGEVCDVTKEWAGPHGHHDPRKCVMPFSGMRGAFSREVAMVLLFADLCAVAPPHHPPAVWRSSDAALSRWRDEGASQIARGSLAPSAFFCLWPAGERRCGQVPACAAHCSAAERQAAHEIVAVAHKRRWRPPRLFGGLIGEGLTRQGNHAVVKLFN
jgi:hypothetical protein